MDIRQLCERFVADIQDLASRYGEQDVLTALQAQRLFSELPSLSDLTVESLVAIITEIQMNDAGSDMLNEVAPAVAGTGLRAWAGKQIKKLLGPVAAAGGIGLGAAAVKANKAMDQDVNIADVTTQQALPVTSPSMEALLKSTQQMIANLTSVLQKALAGVDNSVDYIAAGLTGQSLGSVQAAQAAGTEPSDPEQDLYKPIPERPARDKK